MKNLTLLLNILFLVSNTTFANSNWLEKARTAYQLKAYHLASNYYQNYFLENPGCHEDMIAFGDSYWQIYKIKKSIAWYSKAYICMDFSETQLATFSEILIQSKKYNLAQDVIKKLEKVNKRLAKHFIQRIQKVQDGPFVDKKYLKRTIKENSIFSERSPTFYKDQLIYLSDEKEIDTIYSNFPSAYKTAICQINNSDEKVVTEKNYKIESLAYSQDGKKVTFTVSRYTQIRRPVIESNYPLKIFIAKVDPNGQWSNIQSFPYNDDSHSLGYSCFSPNGQKIYFASNKAGGAGGYDLYVSSLRNDSWSVPKNLGPTINSSANEITPYISSNHSFYFASDRFSGLGGFDIYIANPMENGWLPTPLDQGINSIGDDYGFIFSEQLEIGYFVSNRYADKSQEDIFEVRKKPKNKVVTNIIPSTSNQTLMKNTAPTKTTKIKSITNKTVDNSLYKIRLGAFKNPKQFNIKKVENKGSISTKNWNGYTIYFLEGFNSKQEAQQTLATIKGTDFKNATVVVKKDGRYKSVK